MKANGKDIKAAIFAIDRLRIGTDGPGITTLVTFMGCPLRCKYCINDRCHDAIYEDDGKTLRPGIMMLTPKQLYNKVKIDNIYFQATGGGICFGGGEPGLQAEFIEEFRRICGDKWKITIETALAYKAYSNNKLFDVVDYWIIDVKTLDRSVYEKYTGQDIDQLFQYLSAVKDRVSQDNVIIKIPDIPGYTTDDSLAHTMEYVERLGFKNIKRITYKK